MDAHDIATELRARFRGQPFSQIRFWGFSTVPPNDQGWVLVSTHAEEDRLELAFVHHSGAGRPSIITVTEPSGLRIGARGVAIDAATRLHLNDSEAWREGDGFVIRTARGEGRWPLPEGPALSLGRPPEAP